LSKTGNSELKKTEKERCQIKNNASHADYQWATPTDQPKLKQRAGDAEDQGGLFKKKRGRGEPSPEREETKRKMARKGRVFHERKRQREERSKEPGIHTGPTQTMWGKGRHHRFPSKWVRVSGCCSSTCKKRVETGKKEEGTMLS